MKYLFIIFSAITLMSCRDLDIQKVSYSSSTMMGRTVISVTADSVVTTFNGRGEPTYNSRATKASEWEGILKSLIEVDLNKIAELEAPSNGRMTDASSHAQFIIDTKDSTYTSAPFDGKNPHEMLMPLMKEISSIQEANN